MFCPTPFFLSLREPSSTSVPSIINFRLFGKFHFWGSFKKIVQHGSLVSPLGEPLSSSPQFPPFIVFYLTFLSLEPLSFLRLLQEESTKQERVEFTSQIPPVLDGREPPPLHFSCFHSSSFVSHFFVWITKELIISRLLGKRSALSIYITDPTYPCCFCCSHSLSFVWNHLSLWGFLKERALNTGAWCFASQFSFSPFPTCSISTHHLLSYTSLFRKWALCLIFNASRKEHWTQCRM